MAIPNIDFMVFCVSLLLCMQPMPTVLDPP